ncbi:hypothetical protein [Pseudovibrio sp. JE062]|uniref:hypothetical protein n=1 Tax=Pseudovibrio sp. JE062 TaxID=439495 RepID=UPI000186C63B|nr:hypothetical protein [Pseudovibrio sp. JE062]EEA95334.1 hypothetical protein PJE062_2905 [Pseudovibrio sp. JE062]
MLTYLTDCVVQLDKFGLKRIFPKHKKHREEDFKDKFDASTLFYDVFRSFDGAHIILIGPKPLGYEAELAKASFAIGSQKLKAKHRKLKQIHEIWIRVSPDQAIDKIDMTLNGVQIQLNVSPSACERFKGKHALSTLCKDTPVPWILDWVRFNVVNHGVNALVLFENSESPKRAQDIHDALEQSDLDIEFEVVHAPFKYGPPKMREIKFLQRSILQLLRWKYVQTTEALLFCDVDEFVVCEKGASVFSGLKDSFLGYFLIPGIWVEPVTNADLSKLKSLDERRHHMFQHTTNPPAVTHRKWVAVPSRIPKNIQFKAHGVRPEPKHAAWLHPFFTRMKPFLRSATLCHFNAISTSWKTDRDEIKQVDTSEHIVHEELQNACEAAFSHKIRETELS